MADTVLDKGKVGSQINMKSTELFFLGSIQWLFDDVFCTFSHYQLCFNVSAGYHGGNYVKWIIWLTCSNCFANPEGQAPPSCVSISVFGNHVGTGTEYHFIPACFLKLAAPHAKDQFVLVLQGDLQGQVCQVIRWVRKEKKAVITLVMQNECIVVEAGDICLVFPLSS